jgi:hypothetical protein
MLIIFLINIRRFASFFYYAQKRRDMLLHKEILLYAAYIIFEEIYRRYCFVPLLSFFHSF